MYGRHLSFKEYRKEYGFKAHKTHIKISSNPSTIDQDQTLEVKMPNLSTDEVIIPNTFEVTFNLELEATNPGRILVDNFHRNVINRIDICYEGNEVHSIHDIDIWKTYTDRWMSNDQRKKFIYHGLDDDKVINKIRVNTDKAKDTATTKQKLIAKTFGKRFSIHLADYYELLKYLPYTGIDDRLSFKLFFNSYHRCILDSAAKPDAKYKISDIAIEYDVVKDRNFAQEAKQKSWNISLPFDRILRHMYIPLKKEDTTWNIQVNVPSQSLKALVLIFKDDKDMKKYAHNTEHFYNPQITSVDISIDGEVNQLYAKGLTPLHHYKDAYQFLAHKNSRMTIGDYLDDGYCLLLDFRSTHDNFLHGSGRKITSAANGILLTITKDADGTGPITCYLYVLQDAYVSFENGRLAKSYGITY